MRACSVCNRLASAPQAVCLTLIMSPECDAAADHTSGWRIACTIEP